VNHPGSGGELFAPSIDWIDALEVRGLGAGAQYGEFQGGIINAVTKTGTNDWRGSLRANYISPAMTTSNIRPNEEGAEQSMRRELSAEMRGPIFRDRLFYFIGGILTERDVNVPDLTTDDQDDFRTAQQGFRDLRGIAKLTFRPGFRDRLDALISHSDRQVERAGLNGIDGPESAPRVRAPHTFYEGSWSRTGNTSTFLARVAGFESRESTLGLSGDSVPGIQLFTLGRQPSFQNSAFNERSRPRSLGANVTYGKVHTLPSGENRIEIGAEYIRGWWNSSRTRNGGLTWRPYANPSGGTVDPAAPSTWPEVASEWGSEMHIESDVETAALFVQDNLTLLPNLTFTPGLRYGRWSGWLTPSDTSRSRFLAVRHQAVDPRLGMVWDISGRSELVMKAHWGRFHQGMNAVFFDRVEGAGVYSNERLYLQGPAFTDPHQVYSPQQRDALKNTTTGFSPFFLESILSESGAVENYRQPYVEQTVLSVEKKFGSRWKGEVAYTRRVNKDIVGLVDRNLAANYSPLYNVSIRDRLTFGPAFDQNGNPLVIPVLWVANNDLRADLQRRLAGVLGRPFPPTPGYTFADIDRLTFNPDIALTTVGGAKRKLDQASVSLRTEQLHWNGFASLMLSRLRGNIGGLTGYGVTGSGFSAGYAVRPNEGINAEGLLPSTPALEAKLWVGGDLKYGFRGGAFATVLAGDYFAPGFQMSPRFRYQAADLTIHDDALFNGVRGQTVFLESRGNRSYPPRANLDLRLERVFQAPGFRWVFTGDVFNVTGSDAIIERNLTINDQVNSDPTSTFGAPRRRVNPLALQVGVRVEF